MFSVKKHEDKVRLMLSLGLEPLIDFPGHRTGWSSRCRKCGSTVAPHFSTISSSVKKGATRACGVCGARRALLKRKQADLERVKKKLADFGFQLTGPYETAKTKTFFECLHCGEETWSTSDSILSGGKSCRCSKRPRRPLSVYAPELAKELAHEYNHPLTAELIGTGMRENVWWRCSNMGHLFDASPANRVRGSSCRYCLGMEAYEGETDLATTDPELFLELSKTQDEGFDVKKLTRGSSRRVWWNCSRNPRHIFQATPFDRTRNKSGCSICAGKKVLVGDNDLKTLRPEIAGEWDYELNFPQRPDQFTVGSNKKFNWRCSWNPEHGWEAQINTRTKGHGCPQCARVKTGVNDLQTRASNDESRAHLLAEWDESRNSVGPSVVAFSDNDEYWWKCSAGKHESYLSRLSNRWFSLSGCPTCSPAAYSTASPGRFYFLINSHLGAFKVGITNTKSKTDRVKKFGVQGWSPVLTLDYEDGLLIKMLEKRMLYLIREEWRLTPYVSKIEMRGMGGSTETFANPPLSPGEISALIEFEFSSLIEQVHISSQSKED